MGGSRGWRAKGRRCAALTAFLVASLAASTASAHGPMGMQGLAEGIFLFMGVALLLVSAALGIGSWVTALRPPSSVGGVFGRGFLGVSAVLAFGVAALFILIGVSSSWKGKLPMFGLLAAVVLTTLFLVVEFAIAGALYTRSNRHRQSTLAKLLAGASYTLAGLCACAGFAVLLFGAIVANIDESKPRLTSETRRYIKGCEANNASDCNMLGLRYRSGGSGLPPDSKKAADAFQKACDLGAAIGCRNLAPLYAKGDGVQKDPVRAAQLREREKQLRGSAQ